MLARTRCRYLGLYKQSLCVVVDYLLHHIIGNLPLFFGSTACEDILFGCILVLRLSQLSEHYTQGDNHLQQVLTAAQETPDSNGLLKAFIDKVVLA
ncbi:hypothetical protein AAOGI_34540 [Agarivorans albus]